MATDPHELAHAWLQTYGADEAMNLLGEMQKQGANRAVVRSGGAVAMLFMLGWLKSWVGEEYRLELLAQVWREALKIKGHTH